MLILKGSITAKINYSCSQRTDGEEKFGGLLFQCMKRGFDIKAHPFVGAK